jgi:16S rRNA (adenine1518-N6/adenine1519-N6)-dimethyltransferase
VTKAPTRRERILSRLNEMGVEPKKSLGQNFLVSDHVVGKIIAAAAAEPFSTLVEIGPGLGAITEDLLLLAQERKSPYILIELDRGFAEFWRTRAENEAVSLKVIEIDALKAKWNDLSLQENSLLVSNLPYQISSSLVIERSIEPAGINRMVLMFQKEVAQRIGAKPSTSEYGLLTIIAQTFWQTATVCDASPGDFFPPPNVASRVLGFKRRERIEISTREQARDFLSFAKAAFSQRRKLLTKNVSGGYLSSRGMSANVSVVEDWLCAAGFTKTARAEELNSDQFVTLWSILSKGRS